MSDTNSTPTRWSRRLVLQFLAPTLVALLGALVTAVPWVAVTVERHQVKTLAERLFAEARVASEALPWTSGEVLDAACARLAADLGARITVIAPDGTVLGESDRPSASLENHASRPEVQDALATGRGKSVRRSTTLDMRLLYTAWRQTRGNDVRIVRTALLLRTLAANVAHLRRLLVAGIVAAAALGLAAALILSRRMLRRVHRLVTFARRLADGESAPYLVPERGDELGILEAQLGIMARNVSATIAELRVEHERLQSILRSMLEGVLVTDLTGSVVLMNERARDLLELPEQLEGRGRRLIELVRDPQVAVLTGELARGVPLGSRDLTLVGGRTLHVNAAPLRGSNGRPFGFVLVLHDVTELRRLEVVRRDFVANVSHELRTPLTAIKGYAETLLGPAGDERPTARRFLTVIDRHAERLGRLIDDLLTLSDLELGRTPLRLAAVELAPVLDDVLAIFAERMKSSDISVATHVETSTPPVLADADRLQQVLINLVDNAIKYTPAGGRIAISVRPAEPAHAGMVEIDVADTGTGIPAEDLPRLTERFFRVEKARSRALGGTGLGLAIVKHIVQAHDGMLAIDSTLGHGTTVRVLLPSAGLAVAGADPESTTTRSLLHLSVAGASGKSGS
ncbi:MAG: HAMP domain-containing protein [Deltaproteobacteria bacterium]|nr:MAG: HAMP domain-containing protein [Deltaproteobacteria bacterium]